jgi:hypothetical protein
MILVLILLAAIGTILIAERCIEHLPFAIASFCLSAALLLLVVADFDRAILLATLLAAGITGASTVKYNHSALKLIVTDLPLLFAGTVPFFIVQYPRAFVTVAVGSAALVSAAVASLIYGAGPPVTLELRASLVVLAIAGVAIACRGGGAASLSRIKAQRRCFYSTFMASLFDLHTWRQIRGLDMSDIDGDPLPLTAAVPARTRAYPDIIIIQHESIFDPRTFGLPIESTVEGFLAPENSLHGTLNVDIFGGGSWRSEFSVLTGLSSASFGAGAYYLYKHGAGRFHNSLADSLTALGYKTMLTSSCRRSFLDYEKFYRSIGISKRIFTDDFPPPFDVDRFETTNSDAIFLDATLAEHARDIATDPAPRFLYALTNFNHGPHERSLAAPGQFERERRFAAASLPDARYVEYYARLAETASTWKRLKSELAEKFPERPMLVVHYGDHQPVLARHIDQIRNLREDEQRAFRTFYAIEALNLPDRIVAGRGAVLDIAFLGTVALQQAGLPLDPVFATRASLLAQCRERYFASASERKRRFHRTLADLGLIELGSGAQRGR